MTRVEVEARSSRSRMWTYLILMGAIVVGVLLINVVFSNPAAAKASFEKFLGLPGWALTLVAGAAGALIFWLGLKVEADWPEYLGSFLIAGAVASAEIEVGWRRFELGGLVVIPYLLPILTLVILLAVGMKKSE